MDISMRLFTSSCRWSRHEYKRQQEYHINSSFRWGAERWCITTKIRLSSEWALFVTYTIIQSITSSEMCYLHLTHPSAHILGAVGSRCCGARGAVGGSVPCSRVSPQSWTIPAGLQVQCSIHYATTAPSGGHMGEKKRCLRAEECAMASSPACFSTKRAISLKEQHGWLRLFKDVLSTVRFWVVVVSCHLRTVTMSGHSAH